MNSDSLDVKRLTAYYFIAAICVFIGISACGRFIYGLFHNSLQFDLSIFFFFIGQGLFNRNERSVKSYRDFLLFIFILFFVAIFAILVFYSASADIEWDWEHSMWLRNVCIAAVALFVFGGVYRSYKFMSSEWVRDWVSADSDDRDKSYYHVSWIMSLLICFMFFVSDWTHDTLIEDITYYSVRVTAVDELSGEVINGLSVAKSQSDQGLIKEIGMMSSGTSMTVSWIGDAAIQLTVGSDGYQDVVLNDIKSGTSDRTVVLKRLAAGNVTEQKSPADLNHRPSE